jgi:hypothetical protein
MNKDFSNHELSVIVDIVKQLQAVVNAIITN